MRCWGRRCQTLRNPKEVMEQLVRIARHAIVSVPNFGHVEEPALSRLYWADAGDQDAVSYQWYDTPNIHFLHDHRFHRDALCEQLGLTIEKRLYVTHPGGTYLFPRQRPVPPTCLASRVSFS